MKKVLIGVLLLSAGAYFYIFHLSADKRISPISVIPPDASIIVDLEDPLKQWKELTSNKIWEYLKTNPHLAGISKSIDSINTQIENNKSIWNLVAARPVVVSIHEVRRNKYDYLYVVDLQKAAKFSFAKDYLNKLAGDEAKVITRNYHGGEIIEVRFDTSPMPVYLYFNNNLVIVSNTHTLIEQSIDQGEEPVIARDLNFIDVSSRMDGDQPKIYLQHQFFAKYIGQWLTEEEESLLSNFIGGMIYSGLNMQMTDDQLSAWAYSSLVDSAKLLPKALHSSGSGKVRLAEIAPDRTSFFATIGFDNANTFYKNLEKSLKSNEEGATFIQDRQKLEKFLNLDIEENLLSWIDDEIGVLQLHSKESGSIGEFAIAIRHNDRGNAIKNLDYIKKQVKKKTPVKFQDIEYKGYHISFLSIKGFFKVIFGSAFNKIDKPYYVIMENYVVFSNQPSTLGKIINASLDGNTLINKPEFERYMDYFDDRSTLFAYINPKQLNIDSKTFLDNDSWKMLEANRAYIENFPMIGLQISPFKELFKTQLTIQYMDTQEVSQWNELFDNPLLLNDPLFVNQIVEEDVIEIDDILPNDLNDQSMTHAFENGQVKFEVALKDGKKDGTYREYDSSGNVIIKGRYKNDEKTGLWKYYDAEGNVLKKERY